LRLFLGSFANIDNLENIKKEFLDILEGKWVEDNNLHLLRNSNKIKTDV